MKQNKNELDVDFISGTAPLTKEEEKTISLFIKASKERRQKQKNRKKEQTSGKSVLVNEGIKTD